jgi:hypothetical protein
MLRKRRGEYHTIQTLNYRISEYDVAFAMSITDEILLLEPMEDKLTVLKTKYEMNPIQIIKL